MSAAVTVTEPGVYEMPAETYHADPVPEGSLSQSGAKTLLRAPALFAYEREHGRAPTKAMDFGQAAHARLLGTGPEIVVVDADDWKTKAAQDTRKGAHADGAVAMLAREVEQLDAMVRKLREHPVAAALLQPESGTPEQSLFWRDAPTGVWRRARLDWLPHARPDGRLFVADYKSARSAEKSDLEKAIDNYGYHQQADWYLDGIRALGLAADPVFLFVFQEKTPPYLVNVVQPDAMALRIGRHLNRQAIDLYAECVRTGRWPGYSDDVELVGVPGYTEYRFLQETT